MHSSENKNVSFARKSSSKGRKSTTRYNPEEEAMNPEERERLHTRRQRNKEAAARCRKRRVDQTNTLQEQVDQWMEKKSAMEEEIGALTREKEELEFILSQHCQSAADGLCALGGKRRRTMIVPAQIVVRRTNQVSGRNLVQHQQAQQINVFHRPKQNTIQQTHNRVVAIKSEPTVIVEPVNQPYILPEQIQIPALKVESNPPISILNLTKTTSHQPLRRPIRPISLGVLPKVTMVHQQEQQSNKLSEHGISIDTPSSIVPNINFDTFGGSTGLTPTATPVSGFSFPLTSVSTPGTLNTPMTSTAPTIGSRCSTQQRSSEVATGSVSDINSPEGISLVSL
jgi:fos-like antigen